MAQCTILIANKCDIKKNRCVSELDGRVFADEYNMGYIECDASKKSSVDKLFTFIYNWNYENENSSNIESTQCKCTIY